MEASQPALPLESINSEAAIRKEWQVEFCNSAAVATEWSMSLLLRAPPTMHVEVVGRSWYWWPPCTSAGPWEHSIVFKQGQVTEGSRMHWGQTRR